MKEQTRLHRHAAVFALCLLLPRICPGPTTPACPDCGQTYDNGADDGASGEFVSNGDFNGDGLPDFVVLDKASGVLRLALATAGDDGFAFSEVQSAGVTDIRGMAVGDFLNGIRSCVAVASPLQNRVHVLDLSAANLSPILVTPPSAGPGLLGPLDVPGTGNNGLEELVLTSDLGIPAVHPRHILRHPDSATWTPVGTSLITARPLRLQRLLADGNVWALGAILDYGSTNGFELWTPGNDTVASAAGLAGLPTHCRFASGAMETTSTDLFFYVRGSSTVRTSRITQPSSGTFALSPLVIRNLSRPVQAIYTTTRGSATDLLVVHTDQSVDVFSYTLAGGFTLLQQVSSGAAGTTGVVPLHDAGFVLLSPSSGDSTGTTSSARRFRHDGTGYVQTWQGTLPDAKPLLTTGNILLFDKHPLADSTARLLSVHRARQWTSSLLLRSDGTYTGTAESLGSPATGLHDPAPIAGDTDPGPEPGGALLGNQTAEDMSLFTPLTVLGRQGDELSADPPGGAYDASVKVTLSARRGDTTIYWRTAGTAAFQSGVQPSAFYTDTTLEFYGRTSDGALTPRQSAVYSFRKTPAQQDSDGDGVPDFVERALGMDPNGSLNPNGTAGDYDGDGFSDLDEILAGGNADPADPLKTPASDSSRTDHGGDKLALTVIPRGLRVDAQGQVLENTAAVGTVVQVHDTTGALLGEGKVGVVNGVRQADLVCTGIHDRQRILIVTTQSHFQLPHQAGEPDPAGREVCGVLTVPAIVPDALQFTFDENAAPTTEAQRWITARRAATTAHRPAQSLTINYQTTAKLVLLERLLRDLCPRRGFMFSGSLTPFRDVGSFTYYGEKGISFASMDKLASAPDYWSSPADINAWRITDLAARADSLLTDPADPALQTVLEMARDIYRISAAYHNDHPGLYAMPLDELREFVQHSLLDSAYSDQTTVPMNDRMSVSGAMYAISFATPTRPVFQGTGSPNTPTADTTLHTTFTSGSAYNLVKPDGGQWQFPGSFGLLAGSEVQVTAFNDMGTTDNRANLEVITTNVTGFDLGPISDTDGNLLSDGWERYFLGGLGHDAYGHGPGSAYSLLQEYLEGSDPTLTTDQPFNPPVDLRLSDLRIEPQLQGDTPGFALRWKFPEGYGSAFRFRVEDSGDLLHFMDSGKEGEEAASGNFAATMPKGPATSGFFRVTTKLR